MGGAIKHFDDLLQTLINTYCFAFLNTLNFLSIKIVFLGLLSV